jgi:hypothetical protein
VTNEPQSEVRRHRANDAVHRRARGLLLALVIALLALVTLIMLMAAGAVAAKPPSHCNFAMIRFCQPVLVTPPSCTGTRFCPAQGMAYPLDMSDTPTAGYWRIRARMPKPKRSKCTR